MSNKFINSFFFSVRHGGDERIYRLEFVSNQPFSDNEFIRWKESLQKEVDNHNDGKDDDDGNIGLMPILHFNFIYLPHDSLSI